LPQEKKESKRDSVRFTHFVGVTERSKTVEWARSLGKPICDVRAGTDASHGHAPVEYINFG
jgi:hypothetical protein